jgi:hypothetical protein
MAEKPTENLPPQIPSVPEGDSSQRQPWPWPFNLFQEEWPEVRNARRSFFVCGIACAVVGGFVIWLLYSIFIISGKDATIVSLNQDVAHYKGLAEHPESNPSYSDLIKQRDETISNLRQSVDSLRKQLGGLPGITIDFLQKVDTDSQRPNLLIYGSFTVTNEEPMNKLVIKATVAEGDGKIITMGSDGIRNFDSENISNGKVWIYTAFPVHRGQQTFFLIISGPCSIKLTSKSLSAPVMLKVGSTNIVESYVN